MVAQVTQTTLPASVPLLPAPPRSTGNPQQDLPLIVDWMYKLYQVVIVNQYYISQNSQTDAQNFDASSLPDPSNTNLATAQDTANKAYGLAFTAEQTAQSASTEAASANTIAGEALSAATTPASTSELGVVKQGTAVADGTDATLNALLASLRAAGVIST